MLGFDYMVEDEEYIAEYDSLKLSAKMGKTTKYLITALIKCFG